MAAPATRGHAKICPERLQVAQDYIEQHDGGYWVAGTRVSLDSIVCAFLRGASPESIAQSFSVLRLEEIYGAIAFYLGHLDEVDSYLDRGTAEFAELREKSRKVNQALYRRMEESRDHSRTPRR